jgi:hypothetical protein
MWMPTKQQSKTNQMQQMPQEEVSSSDVSKIADTQMMI